MKNRIETVVNRAVCRVFNGKYSSDIFEELAVIFEQVDRNGIYSEGEFTKCAPLFTGYDSVNDCRHLCSSITDSIVSKFSAEKETLSYLATMRVVMAMDSLGNLRKLPSSNKVKFCKKMVLSYINSYPEALKWISLVDKG